MRPLLMWVTRSTGTYGEWRDLAVIAIATKEVLATFCNASDDERSAMANRFGIIPTVDIPSFHAILTETEVSMVIIGTDIDSE